MTKILKNKRVFAEEGGISTSDAARIITLENNELKITYFTVVSGTEGTIIPPTQATFNSDEFGLSGNALLSEIDINGKPTFQSPTDFFGRPVTATLNVGTGDWLASGIYTSTDVALIYSLNIKTIYYSNLNYFNIIESESVSGNAVTLIQTSGLIVGGPITDRGVISTLVRDNRLVGRGSLSGPGEMEEIFIGAGLTLSGNTLDSAVPQLGSYGAWQDDFTQTAAANNTGYTIQFHTEDVIPSGISIVNNGSGNPTRITFANTGIYNIQFSAQFQSLSIAPEDVTIWLRLNGNDVSGSSGVVGLEARKGPLDPTHIVTGWNYVLEVIANDYYELVWSTTNHIDVQMQFYAAGSPPPSACSAAVTITQQSGIMAGTGITAINGVTDSAQTLTTGTTGTDFAIVESAGDHKFNLPDASATARGVVTTSDQTFAGNKIFTGSIRSNVGLILEDPNSGTNTVTIQADTPPASYTLTLPPTAGTNGYALTTNGTGILNWTALQTAQGTGGDIQFKSSTNGFAVAGNSGYFTWLETNNNAGNKTKGALNIGPPVPVGQSLSNNPLSVSHNINDYAQMNMQNLSSSNAASSDIIATADNGSDTTNYVDLGINSSTYNQAAYNIGGPDDSYLSANGGNLTIGTESAKDVIFHTNGATTASERMRITSAGNINFISLTASQLLALDASKNLQSLSTTTYPSLTELSYVKGVTSAIQTQINTKAPIATPVFTTNITTPLINGVSGNLAFNNAVQTSGASSSFVFTNPANTNQTLSTEISSFSINSGTRQWATGAITTQRENLITAPTFSFVGASTITSAATLAVTAAPIAGTNATITNAYSIWSQSGAVRVNDGTSSLIFRQATAIAADPCIFLFNDQVTAPSATNYILKVSSVASGNTFLNGNAIALQTGGSSRLTITNGYINISNSASSSGALTSLQFNPSSNTNQTASTEQKSFDIATCTSQHATGALTTQRFAVINAPTYSFVGASTITNAATLAITAAPIAGTNATITNPYALWVQGGKSLFAGNIELTQTVTTETVVSNKTVTIVINGTTYKLLAV